MDRNLSEEKRLKILSYLEELEKKFKVSDLDYIFKIQEVEKYIDSETYGLIYEKHSEDVLERLEKEVPVFKLDKTRKIVKNGNDTNFIIEGDNLHSLYLLARTHKHNIDMIYIDPPYNTGATDWKYNNNYVDKNDGYRHSKWLSMMYERLNIAKHLLKKDGVLVCAIDENELATVTLLLESVFGLDYHIDTICIVHNPRGVQGDNFSYTNEYALFVYKKGCNPILPREIGEEDIDWRDLRDNGHESLRSDAATCFYAINVKNNKIIGFGPNKTKDESFHPKRNEQNEDGSVSIYPIDKEGIERKWRYNRDSVLDIQDKLRIKNIKGILDIELGKNTGTYRTVWTSKKYDSNEYGTKLINDMVPTNDFDFPKSLYNTYECLNAVVRNRPNALVLDFFAGSGTTGHALLLMNKLLGGNRHFILCTNNAIGNKKEKEFAKAYPKLVNDDKTLKTQSNEYKNYEEKYGIARSVTFPRIKAAIEGYQTSSGNKTILYESKLNPNKILNTKKYQALTKEIEDAIKKSKEPDDIEIKIEEDTLRVYQKKNKGEYVAGLGGNVLYYKTEFVPLNDDNNELSENLINHIKEMIYLHESKIIDDRLIISSDEKLEDFLKDAEKFKSSTVYLFPNVLIGDDDKKLFNKNGITFVKIPDIFFEKELRRVGEL